MDMSVLEVVRHTILALPLNEWELDLFQVPQTLAEKAAPGISLLLTWPGALT